MNVSIDFWNCLGIPNPEYAKKRTALLKDITFDQKNVADLYYQTKKKIDQRVEKFGAAMTPEWCAGILCSELAFTLFDAKNLSAELQRLFNEYPPFISPHVIQLIVEMQESGHTFNLASNTNFIGGATIRNYLNELGLNFPMFFSDELGVSKPHASFFENLPKNSIHIGDSVVCDYNGATEAGFKAILVTKENSLHGILSTLFH